jgi:hypothetical protein
MAAMQRLLQKLRESKAWKMLGDISLLHWLLSTIPSFVAGIAAWLRTSELDIAILLFAIVFALVMFGLHELEKRKAIKRSSIATEPRRPKHWRLLIPIGAVVLLLIFPFIFGTPVYGLFRMAYKNYASELGQPLASVETKSVYEANHEHAVIIWLQTQLTIFAFPRDQNRDVMIQPDPAWPDQAKYYDPAEGKKAFPFCAAKELYPPVGGIAAHWLADPNSWEWVGCREWHCAFHNVVFDQKFEHGWIVGPVRVSETRNAGELIILLNDKRWYRFAVSKAPDCEAPK